MFKLSIQTVHFIKPVWHSSTGLAPSLSALLSLFPPSSFLLNRHLFSLTSLPPLFSLPSPVLSLATISFPLFPLPLFFALLCSWFSVLFMKSCSPRVCLNCILQKKKRHHKTPALASHNSPNAISSDFVCLHDSVGLFVDLVNHEPVLFTVAHLFTFNLMLRPRFRCTLTYKRWLVCVFVWVCACVRGCVHAISYSHRSPLSPPPSFWPISIMTPPFWQSCISSSLPYVKVRG